MVGKKSLKMGKTGSFVVEFVHYAKLAAMASKKRITMTSVLFR